MDRDVHNSDLTSSLPNSFPEMFFQAKVLLIIEPGLPPCIEVIFFGSPLLSETIQRYFTVFLSNCHNSSFGLGKDIPYRWLTFDTVGSHWLPLS